MIFVDLFILGKKRILGSVFSQFVQRQFIIKQIIWIFGLTQRNIFGSKHFVVFPGIIIREPFIYFNHFVSANLGDTGIRYSSIIDCSFITFVIFFRRYTCV